MDQVGFALKTSLRIGWGALPSIVVGFLVAGFVVAFMPKSLIAAWMGHASGWRGLLTGTALGVFTPGLVTSNLFPVVGALIEQDAGAGPLIAFITAWALNQLQRLVIWEIPYLGWQLALMRFGVCLVLPPIIGLLCSRSGT